MLSLNLIRMKNFFKIRKSINFKNLLGVNFIETFNNKKKERKKINEKINRRIRI